MADIPNSPDPYGYGAALQAALGAYEFGCRRSGRTTRLVVAAKNGDIIVTTNQRYATELRHLLKEAGKTEVQVLVVGRDDRIHGKRTQGSVLFDHDWVRQRYQKAIDDVAKEMGFIKQSLEVWPAAPNPF